MEEEIKEQRSCSVIEDQSGGGQEFWAMMNGSSRNDQNPIMPKTENNFYGDEVQVSAVQISYIEDAGNKSSQEFSKDLIELEGDSLLVKAAKMGSERKDISIDRSPFQYKRQTGGISQQQQPRLIPFDPPENKDRVNNKLFPAESPDPFENQSAGDDKMFDDPDFEEMPIPNSKNEDFVNENSMILIDEDQQN